MWYRRERVDARVVGRQPSGTLDTAWAATGEWDRFHTALQGCRAVDQLHFAVAFEEPPVEFFLPAPNAEDVRWAHPLQTVCLAGAEHHPHFRFGPQWMFTPPPLVLPMRFGDRWYGLAVVARPGRNQFSAVSYVPRTRDAGTVVVWYDGYYADDGPAAELWFSRTGYSDPIAVIAAYAEALRAAGYAPRPVRQVPAWWREPFLCPWGEQCNLANAQRHPRRSPQESAVTSYETQANQERWFQRLEAEGIPVGVVSLSDKWQRDRWRLVPDEGRYGDLKGFVAAHHAAGRHVLAWWGLWEQDGAPLEWCMRDADGRPVTIDPQAPEYRALLEKDITRLLSPDGYDLDGFFLDFTAKLPAAQRGLTKAGPLWGLELLHDYLALIYRTAKAAKPDALIMTHCPHPYFADVTDVLRLNDWAVREPNVVEQARYRQAIATACSDWLINTDNWPLYDADQWRAYLDVQPTLGIPASWFTHGVLGEGSHTYDPFTPADYAHWRNTWTAYRAAQGLPPRPPTQGGGR